MTASAGEVGLRRILAVVDLLIQAVDEDALLPALLPGLLGAIPAENVIWTTRPAPYRSVTHPAGLLTPDDHAVVGRYRTTDPLIRMTTGGPGVPLRRSDLQSWAEWHAQPIYTDVARRIGGEYQLAMELPLGGTPTSSGNARSVCVALNRTGLDFSDDDVAAAALLRGRIRAALVRLERTGRIDQWSPCGGAATAPTPREAAVLDLLALGLTDQQISRRLGISPRTVDKHLEHVYAKFAVHGRVEAANAWRGQHR